MEHVDCNKNHLRYKLTQYLSHLICKSRQCILINIDSVSFKLKLNLQPEQGGKKWSVAVCEAKEGVLMKGSAGDSTAAVPTASEGTHTWGTLSTPKTPAQKGWESQMEKHFLQAHTE